MVALSRPPVREQSSGPSTVTRSYVVYAVFSPAFCVVYVDRCMCSPWTVGTAPCFPLLSPLLPTLPYYRLSARTRLVCAYDIPPRSCLIPPHRIAYLVSRPSRPHFHSHSHPHLHPHPHPHVPLRTHRTDHIASLSIPVEIPTASRVPNLRVPALGFRIVDTLVVHWNLYYSCPPLPLPLPASVSVSAPGSRRLA